MEQNTPSRISDIAQPILLVELKRLRNNDGTPVRVQCEAINELAALGDIGLPIGVSPQQKKAMQDELRTRALKDTSFLMQRQHVVIEAGTMLLGPNGEEIRPAFWFTEQKPGALPGRWLSAVDTSLMFRTIMELSGYIGGPAEQAEFPASDEVGSGDGVAPVDAGEGDSGGAFGPDAAVTEGEMD